MDFEDLGWEAVSKQTTVIFNRSVKCDGKTGKLAIDPPQLNRPTLWSSPNEVAKRNSTKQGFKNSTGQAQTNADRD
jgi:hypothetical protein